MRFQLTPGRAIDVLLDLPWHEPLDQWDTHQEGAGDGDDRGDAAGRDGPLVLVDDTVVELRELPAPDAERANRVLRELRDEGVSVVDVVGVVTDRTARDGATLPAVLLTVRPRRSFTHTALLGVEEAEDRPDREAVVEAAVELLVGLHLAGFDWGDGSLARMRFRRDAGRLSAVLVEVGAGERHTELTTGQRLRDLEATVGAIAAELATTASSPDEALGDLHVLRHDVRTRYRHLWRDLTSDEELTGDDRTRSDERLRRVNELGFDVEEVQVTGEDDGLHLRLGPAVLEPGHHRRRLRQLTGLTVQENQARRLLRDIDRFHVAVERTGAAGPAEPEHQLSASAVRWLHEVFEPTVTAVPAELRRADLDDAEVFHEVLEHRYYLSERAGHDVGTQAAVDAYVADVLAPGDGTSPAAE